MELTRTFQFRLEPTGAQHGQITRFVGACRWVWNKALEEQKRLLELGESTVSYGEMCAWLTQWRHDPALAWLADAPAQAQQHRLRDLDRAVKDAFRPKGHPAKKDFPTFRKRGKHDSFRYPSGIKVELRDSGNAYLFLPKIGWVRFRASRALPPDAKIAQATVLRDGDHWFVSIQSKYLVPDSLLDLHDPVGIDMGVVNFATLSDGSDPIEPLNAHKKIEKKLARAQRRLARKQKYSANWRKQKKAVAKLKRRERNARRDFLHQTSTTIAKNHGVVVIEDLKVQRMTKSGKGTKEKPGKNVKVKARFNKGTLDQGWYMFRQMLDYKLQERGGILHVVDPAYTSQTCPACGHISPRNRCTQAAFACTLCGFSANADKVAAHNILQRGLLELQAAGYAVSGCGGLGQRPPYEAATHGKRAAQAARRPGISVF